MRVRQSDWVPEWVDRFGLLVRDPGWKCQPALKWMEAKGCDISLILELVAGSTHPKANTGAVALNAKKNIKLSCQSLDRLHRQIGKMQEVLQELKTEPVLSLFPEITIALPKALQSASGCLARPELQKAFDLHKFPRGFAMIALCMYVKRVTRAPAYSRIADLLEAGYEAHGTSRLVHPTSLARRVRRFKKDYPTVAESIDAYVGH
jgi:hypothetical protein